MRRNYLAEEPPELADSRITPVQFNIYSPYEKKSKPGWKNPNHKPGSKMSDSSRQMFSGSQILSDRSEFRGEVSTLPQVN